MQIGFYLLYGFQKTVADALVQALVADFLYSLD